MLRLQFATMHTRPLGRTSMDDDPYPPPPRLTPVSRARRHCKHPPSLPPTGDDARV
ncbi:hypothetical protein FHY09_002063 [Xanthomonas sp. 60]